ncbi:molybdopterin-dependent oxidoreductase [Pandoraea sp. ISTKB]|uniref:molybdopterin-dependent oxidoreductase n=1 Tax=Pandoraea sp. ISTKB TaxID=1586708 RepID=UPI000846D26D|nr:molybdopterin-dependent oxidoreductase [Pandoraea sp. ISTKB]ODP32012.1 molybdopterin-dependent oxidoreductase [Pandoraea sp. ISTKB]
MKKRQFLAGAVALGASVPVLAKPGVSSVSGPSAGASSAPVSTPLVTISGAIERHNRGPVDPALDQLFHKQLVQFDAGYALDFAMLTRMSAQTIRPTLEYDAKPHTLRGPRLADVLTQAGAPSNPATQVLLRAIDGYVVATTLGQVREYRFLLATHIDDKPLALGGLGPLWAVYDPAAIPALAGKPLKERFTLCPWGVYHIQVNAVS